MAEQGRGIPSGGRILSPSIGYRFSDGPRHWYRVGCRVRIRGTHSPDNILWSVLRRTSLEVEGEVPQNPEEIREELTECAIITSLPHRDILTEVHDEREIFDSLLVDVP